MKTKSQSILTTYYKKTNSRLQWKVNLLIFVKYDKVNYNRHVTEINK